MSEINIHRNAERTKPDVWMHILCLASISHKFVSTFFGLCLSFVCQKKKGKKRWYHWMNCQSHSIKRFISTRRARREQNEQGIFVVASNNRIMIQLKIYNSIISISSISLSLLPDSLSLCAPVSHDATKVQINWNRKSFLIIFSYFHPFSLVQLEKRIHFPFVSISNLRFNLLGNNTILVKRLGRI